MLLVFEIKGPFRWKPKKEHYGPLHRWIWGWFSVAYIGAGFNELLRAMRDSAEVSDD